MVRIKNNVMAVSFYELKYGWSFSDQVLGMGGTFPLATLKRMGVGRKPLFGPFPHKEAV